jgi:hypothetical protein
VPEASAEDVFLVVKAMPVVAGDPENLSYRRFANQGRRWHRS